MLSKNRDIMYGRLSGGQVYYKQMPVEKSEDIYVVVMLNIANIGGTLK